MTIWYRLVQAIGFDDGRGNGVSFNKSVTFTALWFFGATIYWSVHELRTMPPWYVWTFGTLCVYAGFGFKGLALFRQTESTASQTDSTTTQISADLTAIAKEVLARRDAAKGVDPAP